MSEEKCDSKDGDWSPEIEEGYTMFSPTSCGALFVNDGAVAFEFDQSGNIVLDPPVTGDPVILPDGTTDPICLVAVNDPEGTLENAEPSRSAAADHDDDGLSSWDEACNFEPATNPCEIDTDGDSVNDGVDACPLEGPPGAGEINEGGCNRLTQCNDTIDNDNDGPIDFPADLSCSSIDDDSEDSIDP